MSAGDEGVGKPVIWHGYVGRGYGGYDCELWPYCLEVKEHCGS